MQVIFELIDSTHKMAQVIWVVTQNANLAIAS